MALPESRLAETTGRTASWTAASQRTFTVTALPLEPEWTATTVANVAAQKRSDGRTVDADGQPLFREWIIGLAQHMQPAETGQVIGVVVPMSRVANAADARPASPLGVVFAVIAHLGRRAERLEAEHDAGGGQLERFPLGEGRRVRREDEVDLFGAGAPNPVVVERYFVRTELGPVAFSFAHPHPKADADLAAVFSRMVGEAAITRRIRLLWPLLLGPWSQRTLPVLPG